MDIQRTIIFVIFFTSAFLLWDAWHKQYAPALKPPSPTVASTPSPTQLATPAVPPASVPGQAVVQQAGALPAGQRVKVSTDKFIAEIDTAGGDLRRLTLLNHQAAEDKSKPLVLMRDDGQPLYVTQSGLLGPGLPTHNTAYVAAQTQYQMASGQGKLEVRLVAPPGNGVQVTKLYIFHPGSYVIDIAYEIVNTGTAAVNPYAYYQFLRDGEPPPGDVKMLNTFTGPAVYTEKDKFVKVSFSDIDKGKEPYTKKATNGWLALLQHYFVAAWLPPGNGEREFYTKKIGDALYAAGVLVPVGVVQPGKMITVAMPLYAGPQQVDVLEKLSPGLDLVVDYGWLTIIAAPIFKVLKFIYQWVGNWGVAIILLTVLIKALFYPLQSKASRSMAQMKVLAPKMQKLKEQYGDDRAKLQQAMMEMYKKEKINPLGGCLPILIQIPVFISLYWVLLATVELRHAPFALWIQDLSVADPYFILPVIYALTMFVQMKLQPMSPDPVQQKVMMAMPVVFSVLFIFFPAGLVLYWIVNNVLTIAQQWHINRVIERESAAKVNAKR
ncbi:MAG: membrane protein insertase YidC [Burkholderiales bacterium]|nr:membrane protein insertase YidC [Burkholderiales bacterium]